jgi:hypothetical protein
MKVDRSRDISFERQTIILAHAAGNDVWNSRKFPPRAMQTCQNREVNRPTQTIHDDGDPSG